MTEPSAGASPPAPPAAQPALGKLASRGAAWNFGGYVIQQLLRIGSNLILTRLFPPGIFGLMTLVTTYMTGLQLFSDVGIRPSIVQNKRGDDPAFLNTAWTVQVGRGVILWVVAFALTPAFAWFFEQPVLSTLLPIAAISSVLMGFYSTKLFTASRQINMKRLTIMELSAQIAGLATTIVLAFIIDSIWAIIIGSLVGNALTLLLSHVALSGIKNRFHWDKDAARSLFTFGRWIFISTMLSFIVAQSDRFIMGKLIDIDQLGVYGIAVTLATLPTIGFSRVANQVLFPLYSRTVQKEEPLGPTFWRVRYKLLMVAGWAVAGLIAGGATMMRLFFPPAYHGGGWIVQAVALGGWMSVTEAVNGAALLAIGQSTWNMFGRIAMIIGAAIAVTLGYMHYGFPGAVFGYYGSEVFRYAVSAIGIKRAKLSAFGQDIQLTLMMLASAGIGFAAAREVQRLGLHVVIEAAAVFVAVSIPWALYARKTILDTIRARRMRRQSAPSV